MSTTTLTNRLSYPDQTMIYTKTRSLPYPNPNVTTTFLRPALDCLGYAHPLDHPSQPDDNNANNQSSSIGSKTIQYPPRPWDHYQDINHKVLAKWVGRQRVPYHHARGYQGPWMENYWQQYVQQQARTNLNNDNFHTVFGPYIPLIPAWTDIYVMGGYQGEAGEELAKALRQVLQLNVVYITVCQNDDGFPGHNRLFQQIQKEYNIVVLSSGGYGHVAIPLLKQTEKLANNRYRKVPVHLRHHLVSYVGSLQHAPQDMRSRMMNVVGYDGAHYYYGRRWRRVMQDSKFSLCPRGFGRTSYHVMETLQMGLIPIQVYLDNDIPWIPYPTLLENLTFTTPLKDLPLLLERLEQIPESTIETMEREIAIMRPDYFTYAGVLNQIQLFMVDRDGSAALQCQQLPKHAGSNRRQYFPCE
jgi:hypothetical protein